MADNNDYLPIFSAPLSSNEQVDRVIRGDENIVERSAKQIYISGGFNYVGDDCRNITILNSSGCVISSGIVGSTIINSSGIVVTDPDLLYINNVLYTSTTGGGVTYFGYRKVNSDTIITIDDGTIEVRGGVSHDLPECINQNKMFNIKNLSGVDIGLYTSGSDTIDDDPSGVLTISTGDSVTVQSDGISNYLIL